MRACVCLSVLYLFIFFFHEKVLGLSLANLTIFLEEKFVNKRLYEDYIKWIKSDSLVPELSTFPVK